VQPDQRTAENAGRTEEATESEEEVLCVLRVLCGDSTCSDLVKRIVRL
jgi:hypothetical protein